MSTVDKERVVLRVLVVKGAEPTLARLLLDLKDKIGLRTLSWRRGEAVDKPTLPKEN